MENLQLPIVIGIVSQFILEYTPVLRDKFGELKPQDKFFYAVLLTVILTAIAIPTYCYLQNVCYARGEWLNLITSVLTAVFSNQLSHGILKKKV